MTTLNKSGSRKGIRMVLLLAGLLPSYTAIAVNKPSIFSVKGFGSLIGTGTDSHELGFSRDVTRTQSTTNTWDVTNDSRLGLQIDAKLSENLQATVQWVAKDRGGDFLEQNLEWAFLNWTIQPDLDVRIGRLGVDIFMLSNYRNVGYAYPWIRPPHEFYANLPYYHFDGIDISKKYEVDGGYLVLKAFGGYSFNELPTSLNILFEQDSLNFAGSIQYEKNNWRAKASYAYLKMISEVPFENLAQTNLPIQDINSLTNNPFINLVWPGVDKVIPSLFIKGKEVHYAALGIAYDDGIWLAQAEGSYVNTHTIWYPSQANGYLSLGRRFSTVTLYSLFGITKSLNKHKEVPKPAITNNADLNRLYTSLDASLNGNSVDEKSISLGLRWDFYTNMAFKAQWSHFWIGKNGDRTWDNYAGGVNPDHVNVFSVGVDFMF